MPATAAAEATGTVNGAGPRDRDPRRARHASLAARWNGLELRDPLPRGDAPPRSATSRRRAARGACTRGRTTFGDRTLVLLVGSPLADVLREQREVQEAMLVGIPIVLLLAGGGGLWLASVGLRPITDMARRAARIPPTGLEDLGQTHRTDELGQLARAFNGLVARLRAALQTQRQFMADASHELRTPVSVVRATADVTLSREHRDEAEYREALAIVGGQARRLGRLVDDMLVLARADAGGYPLRPVDLYLDEVVAECRRAVDVLATERGVTIRAAGVAGDPVPRRRGSAAAAGAERAAERRAAHAAGGSWRSTSRRSRQAVRIRVTDEGPASPPTISARIFDRFVQLDAARRGQGAGLGLPIARWIAEAHGGTLVLEHSGPGGARSACRCPRHRQTSSDELAANGPVVHERQTQGRVLTRTSVTAVDEAEQRRVAERERRRRNREQRIQRDDARRGRRPRFVEQPLHARGDVAAVDQRADRLGDRASPAASGARP